MFRNDPTWDLAYFETKFDHQASLKQIAYCRDWGSPPICITRSRLFLALPTVCIAYWLAALYWLRSGVGIIFSRRNERSAFANNECNVQYRARAALRACLTGSIKGGISMRLDADITTEHFLRYIIDESRWQKKARTRRAIPDVHRQDESQNRSHDPIRFAKLGRFALDRCISLASVTKRLTWNLLLPLPAEVVVQAGREENKRQVLGIRTPRKFAGVDNARR